MAYEQIRYETKGKAAIITLNRPEKLNAWTSQMMVEMRAAMDAACADPAVAAIVVTGAGRAFCAGADIASFAATREAMDRGERARDGEAAGADNWVQFLRGLPKPTIAAVNGTAVGIGVTMILPMDIRIAAESARFGMFFVRMGLVPELASSAILPQMVGAARAIEWCLTGRLIPAAEACAGGLASEVVADAALLDRAVELAGALSRNPGPAMASIRKLIYDNQLNGDISAVMRSEGVALDAARRTPEHKEAITAFFEKREPDFSRR
ncbi:MAG: enoyl-CoA hydratase-related protein [Dehalococcoidia bacterium]